jgi:hypothetical protein
MKQIPVTLCRVLIIRLPLVYNRIPPTSHLFTPVAASLVASRGSREATESSPVDTLVARFYYSGVILNTERILTRIL